MGAFLFGFIRFIVLKLIFPNHANLVERVQQATWFRDDCKARLMVWQVQGCSFQLKEQLILIFDSWAMQEYV